MPMLSYDSIRFFRKFMAPAVQWALLWFTGIRMTSLEKMSIWWEDKQMLRGVWRLEESYFLCPFRKSSFLVALFSEFCPKESAEEVHI